MSTSQYRLTVVACALAWFLVGLHAPVVHQWTGHGRVPGVGLSVMLAVLATIASGSVWTLLRAAPPGPDSRP